MIEPSPKHGLSPVMRPVRNGPPVHAGWNKRINGASRWVCSAKVAPTGDLADLYYALHFAQLWESRPKPAMVPIEQVDLGTVADHFIDRKSRADISRRTLDDYRDAVQSFVDLIGDTRLPTDLMPADFARVRAVWSQRFGPDRLAKFIVVVRTMFKWAGQATGAALASTAMDLFGVHTSAAKRRVTRWAVAVLFGVVTALSIAPVFSSIWERESARSLVFYCMSAMFVLLTMQAVQNGEDAHKAGHDIRNELSPIKSGLEIVEKQTNGGLTEQFQKVKTQVGAVEERMDGMDAKLEMLVDLIKNPRRTAGREVREVPVSTEPSE